MTDTKLTNLVKLDNNYSLDAIICVSCQDIAGVPVRCRDCKVLYCKDCADRLKSRRKKCVRHNANLLNYDVDLNIEDIVNNKITFVCKNKVQGCRYETKNISEIAFHLIDCNLEMKFCPNENCDFKGTESDLEIHSQKCKFFSVKCSECVYKFSSYEELNAHNCMIKIVEEVIRMEEMIDREKEILDNYISTKKEKLNEIARIHNLNLKKCSQCNNCLMWVSSEDSLFGKRYFMCSSKNNSNCISSKNLRFYCSNCKIAFCTKCIPLEVSSACYCGKKMTAKNFIIRHFCDICEDSTLLRAWSCNSCDFDVCFNCLPEYGLVD